MDRRWAPAVCGVAVAVLVGGVVAAVAPDREEPLSAAPRTAATPSASPSADPSTEPSAEPSSEPSAEPPAEPTPEPSAPDASPQPAPAATAQPASPSGPVRSAPATQPAPSPTATAAAPPAPAPDGTRSAFGFDAAYGTDEPREVVVQYGDSSSCPHEDVTHTVRESATEVVVTLEADAMDPGRACTADYRQMLVPVRLDAPMGDRVLVDGSRGEPVEVDRSCKRPFPNPPPPKDCTS